MRKKDKKIQEAKQKYLILKAESEYEFETSLLKDKDYKLECLKRRRRKFECDSLKDNFSSRSCNYYLQKAAVLLYQAGEFAFEENGKCEERKNYIEGMFTYCGYNEREREIIRERMNKERMKEENIKEEKHPFKISKLINMILNK